HFKATTFKAGPNANTWTWSAPPYSPIRIGKDASWHGDRLIIPSSLPQFGDWLNALYGGVILTTTGKPRSSSRWGYVSNLTGPGHGTELWADVESVVGTNPSGRFRRLDFEAANKRFPPMQGPAPASMKQATPPSLEQR